MKEGKGYKKGFWTVEEDRILMEYVRKHGKGRWNRVTNMTGLKRCGKSCRLRWINYLCPSVNRDDFTEEEDDLIIRLHRLLGNRWSLIAGRVPGRTDNQVKNHWNTHLSKKLGVKKEKNSKAKASSSQTPFTGVEENLNISMETNCCVASAPAANQKAIEDGVEKTNGLFDGLELTMNDGSESSFWLFNDDLYNLNTPDLREFFDQCSLDFISNEF